MRFSTPRRWLFSAATAAAVVLATSGMTLSAGLGGSAAAAPRGAAVAAAAGPTAGCGKTPTLKNGTYTLQINGKSRTYILKLPDGYDKNHPYRLIFGLHWLGGTATDVANGNTVQPYYGLLRLGDNSTSTIFVAPQGLNNGWPNTGGEDLALIDAIVKQIEDDLCVDTSLLFSTGFSYGAGMSYALACDRPTVFRGVALLSGAVLSGCSGGTKPIGYFQIHGVSDSVLPIAGARSMRDRFAKNNGCTAQNPSEPAKGSGKHILTAFSGCAAGYPFVWGTFDGDHTPVPQDAGGGQTWVPAEVWKFFSQFSSTLSPTTSPTPSDTTSPTPSDTTSPTPSDTTSPTPSDTTSPTPTPTGTCRVTGRVNSWNTGLTEEITITNTGTTAVSGWSLVFTLPSGQTITSAWNASLSPSSGQVTAKNVGFNGAIAPGASVGFGFQASHTGNTATPTSFTLNGATCTVA